MTALIDVGGRQLFVHAHHASQQAYAPPCATAATLTMNEAANADQRGRTRYGGDVSYSVELTDDGKPVVSIEPGN
jgi:hypothetical protein